MAETIVFLDANTLASPVTRSLLLAGCRADGILPTWSAHVEIEADRHARGASSRTSVVRKDILGMELSKSAKTTEGLTTASVEDRQVIADSIEARARFLITVDVDDFAVEDLMAHDMSAVNPDYFMAQRFSEHAYRQGVRILAEVAKNPPRTESEVHQMLGRRHPMLTAKFTDIYESIPVASDNDQPRVLFRGAICVKCEARITDAIYSDLGLCAEHSSPPASEHR